MHQFVIGIIGQIIRKKLTMGVNKEFSFSRDWRIILKSRHFNSEGSNLLIYAIKCSIREDSFIQGVGAVNWFNKITVVILAMRNLQFQRNSRT